MVKYTNVHVKLNTKKKPLTSTFFKEYRDLNQNLLVLIRHCCIMFHK